MQSKYIKEAAIMAALVLAYYVLYELFAIAVTGQPSWYFRSVFWA